MLAGSPDDLDELLDSLAAQANHEDNRRHQERLDDAFTTLQQALDQLPR